MKIYLLGDIGGYTETTKTILKNINQDKSDDDIFVLLGDNFYPNGVTDTSDSLWDNLELFGDSDIYPVLGNHDYLGSIDAQILNDKKNWNLDSYYYKKTFENIDFFFIDTAILQPNYSNLSSSIVKSKTIISPMQLRNEMLEWLDKELNSSKNTKIIVGHYPLISYGLYGIHKNLMFQLLPLIKKHNVKYYMSGHDHNLQIIDIVSEDFSFKQVVSGASSFLYPILKNKCEKAFYSYGYVVIDTCKNLISIMNSSNKCLHSEDFV